MDITLFCGIDPGKTGAFACIRSDLEIVFLCDFSEGYETPFFTALKTVKNEPHVIYLERVHAMPRQGVVSMFNFGMNYGYIRGLLTSLQLNFIDITPQAWQKGLVHKTEGVSKPSLQLARSVFPDAPLSRQKDHNRADALIMAYRALQDTKTGCKRG